MPATACATTCSLIPSREDARRSPPRPMDLKRSIDMAVAGQSPTSSAAPRRSRPPRDRASQHDRRQWRGDDRRQDRRGDAEVGNEGVITVEDRRRSSSSSRPSKAYGSAATSRVLHHRAEKMITELGIGDPPPRRSSQPAGDAAGAGSGRPGQQASAHRLRGRRARRSPRSWSASSVAASRSRR